MHRVYTNISQISGEVITVEAESIGYMEIARVSTRRGVSLAQVISIDGKKSPCRSLPAAAEFLPGTVCVSWGIRCASLAAITCWAVFLTEAACPWIKARSYRKI